MSMLGASSSASYSVLPFQLSSSFDFEQHAYSFTLLSASPGFPFLGAGLSGYSVCALKSLLFLCLSISRQNLRDNGMATDQIRTWCCVYWGESPLVTTREKKVEEFFTRDSINLRRCSFSIQAGTRLHEKIWGDSSASVETEKEGRGKCPVFPRFLRPSLFLS